MKTKYYNDAMVGNKKVTATFTKHGELLRMYYPNVDYRQFVDSFVAGVKINDSSFISLHEDVNNRYQQYYTEDTNILNTEVENSYFKLKIKQTDFVSMKENVLIRKYTFINENSICLNVNFLVCAQLLSDENNMVSARKLDNGMVQYTHDYAFCTFSNKTINGHRIHNADSVIYDGGMFDKDYIGMSADSSISYHIGELKPGEKAEFELYITIMENSNEEKIVEKVALLQKVDTAKEEIAVKKYWKKYVQDHDTLNLKNDGSELFKQVNQIYTRSILLFDLLTNSETGGISAGMEIDENQETCGRYSYCWPRDAVFITKALDSLNMKKETEKFYKTFCKMTQSKNGMWEQRFYTDGRLAPCWGYQIDETASVIYGIYQHYLEEKDEKFLKDTIKMCEQASRFLIKYINHVLGKKEEEDIVRKEIEAMAKELGRETDKIHEHVSYDLWEMNEGVHLYSLCSIFAAFQSMIAMCEVVKPLYENNRLRQDQMIDLSKKLDGYLVEIKQYILNHMYDDTSKTLYRNLEDHRTDISMIGSVVPFNVFTPKEKKILNTVEKINMTLRTYTGGYLRFEEDNYRGGKSPWLIATLWMALYYLQAGDRKKAKECFSFVAKTATEHGLLAEQVDNNTMEANWVIGLGWSHAMFILVLKEGKFFMN